MFKRFQISLYFILLSVLAAAGNLTAADTWIRKQAPELLSFEELKILSKNPNPGGSLEKKVLTLWTTPEISNEAFFQGERPRILQHPLLGRVITAASWNIEKSIRIEDAERLFTVSDEQFLLMLDPEKNQPGSPETLNLLRQRHRLLAADLLVLQEMDIGHKRSGYTHAAQKLARALEMNYAYGAEQLEIDPVYLGTENVHFRDGADDSEGTRFFATDPARYKGVFGSAVLSRYPIKHAEVFQLRSQPYNWYSEEIKKEAFVEKTRRFGSKLIFKNEITREIKTGGRIYFRVDLHVPELPEQTLTVINIHLEIKCQPKGREEQMREILSYIKDIRHPVIVMGDFNSAGTDISPVTVTRIVKRSAKDPATWVNAGITFMTPYGPLNLLRNGTNELLNFQDPFAKNIKILAPNPVKPLFETIRKFRFSDGGAFDFRGDPARSVGGKNELLANSNQRDLKGFKTTFRLKRPLGPWIGKLRLDWVFVKSFLKDTKGPGPYRFAPHFGETLEELNTGLAIPISDHHPNVIDLPLEEPALSN